MAIRTALTERLGIDHPVVLAPMGGASGGQLAAAVSNAGGLGLVGGGYGDPAWLKTQLPLARDGTDRPWGVGFITWNATHEAVALALEFRPRVFMLSFGDPRPFVPAIKDAGCVLFCQVQEVDDARAAVEAGADFVVAQGTEAGGHGATRATLPLVPAVVDAVAPTPVLAAGGIVDGRGLAAALMLGTQGALFGTRFMATPECVIHENGKQRIVNAHARDTQRTHVFDIVRGHQWPVPYTGRAIRNSFLERWGAREQDLTAAVAEEAPKFKTAMAQGDFDTGVVWAGEGVDLISGITPASQVVREIVDQAEAQLRGGAARLA